jgi:hypothetical protein
MTELNPPLVPEPATGPFGTPAGTTSGTPAGTAEAQLDWPPLQAEPIGQDQAVAALLGRLGSLPALPVSDHGEVYARLHDDLAEALNEAGDTAS